AYIVLGHELTHWFQTIYKESEWTRKLKEVNGHLDTWAAEEKVMVRPEVIENAKRLLRNPAVREALVNEIHADCGAFDYFYASETAGWRGWVSPQDTLMRAYVHMAVFFSL